MSAVGAGHDISVFDYEGSILSQFAGVDVVIDEGGSHGTREMMDAATTVKLWQILGTGFDHFDLAYCNRKRFQSPIVPVNSALLVWQNVL
ncbi:MAG: hypothetical protein U0V70_17580 [Terriglobia bacterium]